MMYVRKRTCQGDHLHISANPYMLTSIQSTGFSTNWYPVGTNAFTARKVAQSTVPTPVAGKRRRLKPIDKNLPADVKRDIKNKRNRELMALKRAALRVNPPSHLAYSTGFGKQVHEIGIERGRQ